MQIVQTPQQDILYSKRPILPLQDGYRGRFAPSPSGLLHFGSLITALASFLDAKSTIDAQGNEGKWLVRIEDIDPPREQAGASAEILKTLDAFGLHWDEPVLYQSQQSDYYHYILNELKQKKLCYYCQCTRAEIKALGGIYKSHCRTLTNPEKNSATRLVNRYGLYQFDDIFQGHFTCDKALAEEDFIIHRKDGLFAYQLAVVHDDIYQNITHIIRGCDLLEPTARQLTLFKTLNQKPPVYGHIPLATTELGYKLSKQNNAPCVDNTAPQATLFAALVFLGQAPAADLLHEPVHTIIKWAIKNWNRKIVPKQKEINISHVQFSNINHLNCITTEPTNRD